MRDVLSNLMQTFSFCELYILDFEPKIMSIEFCIEGLSWAKAIIKML